MTSTPADTQQDTPPTPLGIALVLCAPSGTGKSTLVKLLLKDFSRLAFSVSCTTRDPREGEVAGVHYHFLTRDDFLSRIDAGDMLEWAEVHGNLYGTSQTVVEEQLAKGNDVLFDIDVQGAMQLRAKLPGSRLIFLLPPSKAELERRLRGRGTDDEETISRRLANAAGEVARAGEFDYLVVNDDLESARAQLGGILLAEKAVMDRCRDFLTRYQREWVR